MFNEDVNFKFSDFITLIITIGAYWEWINWKVFNDKITFLRSFVNN